jgi:hypothetical protein
MQKFIETVSSDRSESKAVSTAIRGFGYLAGSCKRIMKISELEHLADMLTKKGSWLFSE